MTLRTAARPPSRAQEARRVRQNVNLFAGGTLIAQRWTERARPHPFYEVDHVIYDVTSFVRTVDPKGRPAFDAEVIVRSADAPRYGTVRRFGLGSA